MGCSCSKGIKTSATQPKRIVRPATSRIVHKSTNGSKIIRRVLERY